MSVLMPFLTVSDAQAAIDFYEWAFDSVQTQRVEYADGTIGRCVFSLPTPSSACTTTPARPTRTPRSGSC